MGGNEGVGRVNSHSGDSTALSRMPRMAGERAEGKQKKKNILTFATRNAKSAGGRKGLSGLQSLGGGAGVQLCTALLDQAAVLARVLAGVALVLGAVGVGAAVEGVAGVGAGLRVL